MLSPTSAAVNAVSGDPVQYVAGTRTFTFQGLYANIGTFSFKLTAQDTNLASIKREYTFALTVTYTCLGTSIRTKAANSVTAAHTLLVNGTGATKATATYTHGESENAVD